MIFNASKKNIFPLIRKNGTFIDHLHGWKDRTMHKSISSQKSLLRFSIELDKNKEIFLTISALQCNDKKNIHIYLSMFIYDIMMKY